MKVIKDVHQQFANYFPADNLQPYIYILSKKLSDGHICVEVNKIDHNELLEAGFTKISPPDMLLKEELVSKGDKKAPFILHNNRLYLQRYFKYEDTVLNSINKFVAEDTIQAQNNFENLNLHTKLIKEICSDASQNKSKGTNWQMVAVITALLNKFTIITGGPGTGKTSTVAKILSILLTQNPTLKVALTAPTGKAAARMKESLENASNLSPEIKTIFNQLQPSTIHRLLGVIKDSPHFKFNAKNPLQFDLIIVDESSMIDVALFAKLFTAIGPETKLILLGDKDQLASVEAGSLFGDLCQAQPALNKVSTQTSKIINSFIEVGEQKIGTNNINDHSTHPLFQHIIELQQSHRFSDDKGIGKFSKAIINNRVTDIQHFFENKDEQVIIDTEYSEKIFQNFVSGYQHFINEPNILAALKKINNLRILCAVREGEQGLYAYNKKIENNLAQQKLITITGDFYNNRPIMVTSNNIELQLFNGDIGLVRPDENKVLKVWFQTGEEEVRSVLPGYISTAETVFAMTIHKSQGSEFNKVLVILPKGEEIKILTRELLYTAVTRAKENLIIQGSESLIVQTANAFVERGSGIIERFKEALPQNK